MFTFFHGYLPGVWQGYEKRGLIDENAGVRVCQAVSVPEKNQFNSIAAKGGDLWNLQAERRLPMYVDRLQGGTYYVDYPYDPALLAAWRDLLGDDFRGFQMHEWMNNIRADVRKLERGNCPEWKAEAIEATIRALYRHKWLFLESMSAEELEKAGKPTTAEDLLRMAENLLVSRMKKTNGQLITCDSSSMALQMEAKHGVRATMPEIGSQTEGTCIQISYARGMSRAHGTPFGAYVEPWAGHPATAFCYQREGKNEWGLDMVNFPYQATGETGGSSLSLQERMKVYAYFAGATFMAEEWGVCNTFYDWNDYELSPYGEEKRKFLQLVRKYEADRGEFYAPFGVVLSREVPVLPRLCEGDTMYGLPFVSGLREKMAVAREGIRALLSASVPMCGNEKHPLINSDLPDAFDLLHDDTPAAFDRYEYLIDLTGDPAFAKTHKCVKIEDVPALAKKILPCTVEGGLHWLLNRTKRGWRLVILNNDGVVKDPQTGERTLPEGDRVATVRLQKGGELRGTDGPAPEKIGEGVYRIALASGKWAVAEF